MIYTEGVVNPDTYTLLAKRQDYMNTGPQMIIALIRQLVGVAGVKETDITVCDTLAYLVHEYYDILHAEFPQGAVCGLRGEVRPPAGQGLDGAAVLELPAPGQIRTSYPPASPRQNT